MEMYGYTAPEFYGIDDLLDLSNDHIFSSSDTTTAHHHIATSSSVDHIYTTNPTATSSSSAMHFHSSSDFTNEICVPKDEVAELEWLSNFVDESYTDFPVTNFPGAINSQTQPSFQSRSRSKRSRAPSIANTWTASFPQSHIPMQTNYNNSSNDKHNSPIEDGSDARRCTHCASEKTPQWRTGPLGPKTLCNACGVRYKSGRLVPEYRPAASPTFVLTQHSNSHRKVMELRRQKEEQDGGHGRHHHRNYEVC